MDPNQPSFYSDGVMRLYALCQSTFGTKVKKYYLGLPSQPPTDLDYPALVIQKMTGNYTINATQTDQQVERIAIMLFARKGDNAGGPDDPGITTLRELQNMVEGRDPTSADANAGYPTYQPGTLMYALRTSFTNEYYNINQSIDVSYDITPRASETGERLPGLAQANIIMTLTEKIIVANRT